MQFGYSGKQVHQYQYVNLTNIAGFMSANSTYLTQYFGNNQLGFRMDASSSTWGWNPSFNSSVIPQQYFYFGSQEPLTSTTLQPNALLKKSTRLGASNDTNATSDVIYTNVSYGIASLKNLSVQIMPNFQYLGVPSLLFDAIWVQMNAYGIPVTPYQLSQQNSTWQILWVPGQKCQAFVNTTGFKSAVEMIQQDSTSTTNVSVPMSNLMFTYGSDCIVGVYNSTLSNEILLGQAYLQSFQTNINYALTNPLQFAVTQQGQDTGVVANTIKPTPTPSPSPSKKLSLLNIILISVSSFLFVALVVMFVILGKYAGWWCKKDSGPDYNIVGLTTESWIEEGNGDRIN